MAKATPVPELTSHRPLQDALRALLSRRLADLVAHHEALAALFADPAALPGDDAVERVHDARVASRRLRAALGLARFRPAALRKRARQQVRALGHALGAVRDLDLLLGWLATTAEPDRPPDPASDQPDDAPGSPVTAVPAAEADATIPGLADALAALREDLLEERAAALAALAQVAEPFFAGAHELDAALASLHARGRLAGRRVRRRLRRRLRRFRAWLDPARSGRPDLVHGLRIAAKKLRYHAEPLEDALPDTAALVKALAPLQEELGALHDLDARLRWLTERIALAAQHHLPALAQLLRRLLDQRKARWQRLSRTLSQDPDDLLA